MNKLSREKMDYMARMGLAGDMDRVNYYVEAMENPFQNVTDSFRREYVADVLNKLLNIIGEDTYIYDHIIANLQVNYPNRMRGRDWMDARAESAIESKSARSGIPVHILLEVYDRGYEPEPPRHLTREQTAFNAVNSFIAKGKSWRDNPDLRLWGTDTLANIYRDDTPGQNLNTVDITKRTAFGTIKKAIKK